MPQKAFQIGVNIEAMLQNHDNAHKRKQLDHFSQPTEMMSMYSGSSSLESDSSSISSYDSSDSDSEIDEGAFYDELHSWMNELAVSKEKPNRSNSMHLMGAKNVFPKFKEQIHHPIVAQRMSQCTDEFMQNPEEMLNTRKAINDPSEEKTEDCLKSIFAAEGCGDMSQYEPVEDEFLPVTDERVAAHCKDLTDAARNTDMKQLKTFFKEGRDMQACNRFGDSLVHIVCRRGSTEILTFLLEKANVSLMVRDDLNRNPLHDAMWTDKPAFDMVRLVLETSPRLLFAKDSRGSTPMAYIPRQRWGEWNEFFRDNKNLVLAVMKEIE